MYIFRSTSHVSESSDASNSAADNWSNISDTPAWDFTSILDCSCREVSALPTFTAAILVAMTSMCICRSVFTHVYTSWTRGDNATRIYQVFHCMRCSTCSPVFSASFHRQLSASVHHTKSWTAFNDDTCIWEGRWNCFSVTIYWNTS